MFKILARAKNSWKSIIIIIVFLIIQAMSELSLPDYTSRIVNVGIQQGGIEDCVPEVIRQKSLDTMLIATKDDAYILDKYNLISRGTVSEEEFNKYEKKYPILKEQNIYLLKDIKSEDREKLKNIFAKPLIMYYFIENSGQMELMKNYVLSIMPNANKDDSLIDIVKTLPEEQQEQLISAFGNEIDKKVGGMLEQAGITALREEYKAVRIRYG